MLNVGHIYSVLTTALKIHSASEPWVNSPGVNSKLDLATDSGLAKALIIKVIKGKSLGN